jgi:hypothetical protein
MRGTPGNFENSKAALLQDSGMPRLFPIRRLRRQSIDNGVSQMVVCVSGTERGLWGLHHKAFARRKVARPLGRPVSLSGRSQNGGLR